MQQVQTTLPSGSIVNERYQIEDLLGRGGFGAVYLVRDLRVRQNVFALKEIIDPDQGERRHFTFEAEVLKRTDHPSLPRVYRAFDAPEQGRAYMLMDYIEGINLEKLRRQQSDQRFSLPKTLALINPIVDALSYLHVQQPPIIHRDIKPSNIIAPDSGERTVLVDFGIAKEVDKEATTTVIRHATPGYGAPEQYGTGTDLRTDVYGIGATLYTLLTGTTPVDAFFRMTQHMGKQTDPLLPARQLVSTIPEEVSTAISRAMALEKNDRFATVEDFWTVLLAAVPPLPVVTPVSDVLPASLGANFNQSRRPASVFITRQARTPGRIIVLILLLLLTLGIGFATALLTLPRLRSQQVSSPTTSPVSQVTATATPGLTPTPTATPTPQPTPTPTPQPNPSPTASIPSLVSSYSGTIHDVNGNINTTMALKQIIQHGRNIQGQFLVDLPLNGNGPFTGSIRTNSSIQFTVHSHDAGVQAPLFFSGQIQPNGNISGQYCSLDSSKQCNPNVGGYGSWSAHPDNSGS